MSNFGNQIGMSVKDLLDQGDPTVVSATEDFIDGDLTFEEFKRAVNEYVAKQPTAHISDYERAMKGI